MSVRFAASLLFFLICAPAACAADVACDDLTQLDWLVGTWRAETPTRAVTETWRRVSADTFEGRGVTTTLATGEHVGSETLRLVQMQKKVFYLAMVDANPLPVAFRLTDCAAHFARFENPQHDFPRRLDYRWLAGGDGPAEAVDVLTVDVSDGGDEGFSLRFERLEPAATRGAQDESGGDAEVVPR